MVLIYMKNIKPFLNLPFINPEYIAEIYFKIKNERKGKKKIGPIFGVFEIFSRYLFY